MYFYFVFSVGSYAPMMYNSYSTFGSSGSQNSWLSWLALASNADIDYYNPLD